MPLQRGSEYLLVRVGPIIVIGLAVVLFAPALDFGLINYDDHDYIRDNANLSPLTFETVQWWFSNTHKSNWNPLSWLSHALDLHWFGNQWGKHHGVSLGLHLVNGLLAAWVIGLVLGRAGIRDSIFRWTALFTLTVFLLHPIQVEAVAWIAERKTLLFSTFYLVSVGLWLISEPIAALSRPSTQLAYGACILAAGLAMTAKPMAVSLPVLMLVLALRPGGEAWISWRRLAFRLMPLIVLAGIVTAITVEANADKGTLVDAPLWERLAAAPLGLWMGVARLVGLGAFTPYYPFQGTAPLATAHLIASGFGLMAVMGLAAWQWPKRPWFAIAVGLYLAMLLPVAVPMAGNPILTADRYLYLPLLVPSAALGLWIATRLNAKTWLAVVIVAVLAVIPARAQLAHWRSSEAIWTKVIDSNHVNDPLPLLGRGFARLDAKDWSAAAEDCERARAIKVDVQALQCLGEAYGGLRQWDKAEAAYQGWYRLSGSPEPYNELGLRYLEQGQNERALQLFNTYSRATPGSFVGPYNLAATLAQLGQVEAGCQALRQAYQKGFNDFAYLKNDAQMLPLVQAGCLPGNERTPQKGFGSRGSDGGK